MVKTRSACRSPKPSPPPTAPKRKEKKKQTTTKKKETINNQHLRASVRSKISKAVKEGLRPKERTIDFKKEQFAAITGPEKFQCPICLQTMILPTISECGHSFCLPCLQQSLQHKLSCSLCREPLSFEQFKESALIQEILEQVVERALSEEEKKEYGERVKGFAEKDREKRVGEEVGLGDGVDFYINEAWQEGVVVQKTEEEGEKTRLKVKSMHGELTRELPLSSRLLAKRGTHTREKDWTNSIFGPFRLEVSSTIFRELMIGSDEVQVYPILRNLPFELGPDVVRITFTLAEQN